MTVGGWRFRSQWRAEAAHGATRRAISDRIAGVTIHHSTGATLRGGDDTIDTWVRSIQRYHVHSLGYADIAYNALVDDDGTIYEGRANNVVGAHARSNNNVANRTTLGLCILGNGDTISPAAVEAIRRYLYVVAVGYRPKPLRLFGHRDWSRQGGTPTYCPSNRVEAIVSAFDLSINGRRTS